MITNFEQITAELNVSEKKLIRILVKGFEFHKKGNPILAPEIVKKINEKKLTPKPVTEARLRKMCNFIRRNGILPLIATSKGYYISTNKEEILSQAQSLKDRAEAILKARTGLLTFINQIQ